jgi:hypothetical protein
MFGRFQRFIRFSHVVSLMALVAAMGGTSYAAVKITGAQIVDGSVTGKDLRNRSVKGVDVAPESLGSRQIKGLKKSDFAPGELTLGGTTAKGEKGEKGESGDRGPKGDAGPGGLTLSGRIDDVADGGPAKVTFYGGPLARSTASASEAPNETLSPAVDTTARDLSVRFTLAPCDDALFPGGCGRPGSADVILRVNGQDTDLRCRVTTPATTCTSANASTVIPANSRLAIKVTGDLLGVAGHPNYDRDVLFGFRTVAS